jgi:hypothetical protein
MVMLNLPISMFFQRVVLKEQHFQLILLLRQSMAPVPEHSILMLLILKINQQVINIGLKRKNLAHILNESVSKL